MRRNSGGSAKVAAFYEDLVFPEHGEPHQKKQSPSYQGLGEVKQGEVLYPDGKQKSRNVDYFRQECPDS